MKRFKKMLSFFITYGYFHYFSVWCLKAFYWCINYGNYGSHLWRTWSWIGLNSCCRYGHQTWLQFGRPYWQSWCMDYCLLMHTLKTNAGLIYLFPCMLFFSFSPFQGFFHCYASDFFCTFEEREVRGLRTGCQQRLPQLNMRLMSMMIALRYFQLKKMKTRKLLIFFSFIQKIGKVPLSSDSC